MKKQTRIRRKNRPQTRSSAFSKAPKNSEQYFAKRERFKDTWDRVISVISRMRSEKVSLRKASKEQGISPQTVQRWGGSALQKRSNGKFVAKKSDNLLRILNIPALEGKREIGVRGTKKASQLSQYWIAVDAYLSTGDASGLAKFSGKYITAANGERISFITDRTVLNRLGSAGQISFESLYARSH